MKNLSKRGFTLVELTLVIAIIVCLSGAALVGVGISINHYQRDVEGRINEGNYFEQNAMDRMSSDFSENRVRPTATPRPEAPYAPSATPDPEATPTPAPEIPAVGVATNTPIPQAGNISSGTCSVNGGSANTYNGANHYQTGNGSLNSGSQIQQAVITVPSNVNVTSFQTDSCYRVQISGNTVTITYSGNGGTRDNLPIYYMAWETAEGDDAGSISLDVSYS